MVKIFKFIGAGFLVLILVFLSFGLFVPEIKYQNTILVTASPEESFNVFNDTLAMKQWIIGLSRIEFVEGRMNGVGSKWKLILDQEGAHYEMLETMTAYEPNKRFAFTLVNDVLVTDVDVRFTPSIQGTIITADNMVKGKNILWHSLFVVLCSRFKAQSQGMYDTLKLIIDKSQVPA